MNLQRLAVISQLYLASCEIHCPNDPVRRDPGHEVKNRLFGN